jgi:hypothetical protein
VKRKRKIITQIQNTFAIIEATALVVEYVDKVLRRDSWTQKNRELH